MTSYNIAALTDPLDGRVVEVFRVGYPELSNLEEHAASIIRLL